MRIVSRYVTICHYYKPCDLYQSIGIFNFFGHNFFVPKNVYHCGGQETWENP